ncbi:hypothetical protein [Microbacterium sp. SD291]|uniref:hypothetical protein n=1 Tax=Microbacterium sp. SD291 TaxID=2782007 RepID=UPI001A96144E|nr:hypothetical protein [Microbacterium sp. SD291]MBO0981535.1 hypothetical protein [Microbacterium sp. SD291]
MSRGRLGRGDLERPFHGLRTIREADAGDPDDPYERQALHRQRRIRIYAPRLSPGQFFSHESAAALWLAPLPLAWIADDTGERVRDRIAHGSELPVHVSTLGASPLVRTAGVTAHRARAQTTEIAMIDGMLTTTAACTWASLGALALTDLVALGDYFCRVWRPGPGRPNAEAPPISTRIELQKAIDKGRRVGIRRLREAIELVREDSWSPRESVVRCHLVFAGLPEPELNHDVFDDDGRFLGCVDLAYPARKVAIEYQSVMHSRNYAADVERIAALRAAGWNVIEVTAALLGAPDKLVARVRATLRH